MFLVFHLYNCLHLNICYEFYAGDNLIVGSREGKWCWFDMDLSSTPYKVVKYVSSR